MVFLVVAVTVLLRIATNVHYDLLNGFLVFIGTYDASVQAP